MIPSVPAYALCINAVDPAASAHRASDRSAASARRTARRSCAAMASKKLCTRGSVGRSTTTVSAARPGMSAPESIQLRSTAISSGGSAPVGGI
jgi:hypothetical protein